MSETEFVRPNKLGKTSKQIAKAIDLARDGRNVVFYATKIDIARQAAKTCAAMLQARRIGYNVRDVRDAVAAGTGTIVDIIAASAAIGVEKRLPHGIYCEAGVYADFGGTGTVTFFYRPIK